MFYFACEKLRSQLDFLLAYFYVLEITPFLAMSWDIELRALLYKSKGKKKKGDRLSHFVKV